MTLPNRRYIEVGAEYKHNPEGWGDDMPYEESNFSDDSDYDLRNYKLVLSYDAPLPREALHTNSDSRAEAQRVYKTSLNHKHHHFGFRFDPEVDVTYFCDTEEITFEAHE